MATNRYIRQGVRSEQTLYEDIVIESLKFYGQDVYYLPRTIVNEDRVFGDDIPSRFSNAYKIEMYIENAEGFDGEGDLFTKFGVEIRDQATFVLARRRWDQTVAKIDNEIDGIRPREGDLIWLPLSKSMFQIMKVEHEDPFYQLNNLVVFKLQCELFEFNDEDFDTSIEDIDDIVVDHAYQWVLTLIPPTTATASASVSGERVSSITLTNAGGAYDSAPAITFSLPDLDSSTASATITFADGDITDISVDSGGRYYAGSSVTASVTYDIPGGGTITEDITAIVTNGQVTSVPIPSLEQDIATTISIVFPPPTDSKENYRAAATLTVDSYTQQVTAVAIVDSGYFYANPTVTIDPPSTLGSPWIFEKTSTVSQTLSSGVIIRGEVTRYNDSDNKLYLANVGASDGKFHSFVANRWVWQDSENSTKLQLVGSVAEVNKMSDNEQNDDFDATNFSFLDFSESNPFGEPS